MLRFLHFIGTTQTIGNSLWSSSIGIENIIHSFFYVIAYSTHILGHPCCYQARISGKPVFLKLKKGKSYKLASNYKYECSEYETYLDVRINKNQIQKLDK